MNDKIKLVRNDTRPALVCTIKDDTSGNPLVLTGATVLLKFRALGAKTLTATVTGTVTGALIGQVAFYPASSPEMLKGCSGDYEGEVEITFADGQIQTVYEPLKFKVREDF